MKAPDIKQLRDRDLPQGKFPGETTVDFRVFIDPKAHEQIHKHATENIGVEICGVMVGRWGKDDKGPFLTCSASIRGESATNKFAEVTFTHDTWSKINATMDKEYAGYVIVGWYHTHPDFGIFLSDRDRFIHEHFFSEPGQIALVVDPVRKIEGVFIWQSGKATPCPYYWVGNEIKMAPAEKSPEQKSESRGPSDPNAVPPPPVMGGFTLTLGALCVFMLGYMLSNWFVSYERAKLIETVQNSVGPLQIAQRLRASANLTRAATNMQAVAFFAEAVARNPMPLEDKTREMILEKVAEIRRLGRDLDDLQRQVGVTEAELNQLDLMLSQVQVEKVAATQKATLEIPPPTTLPASVTPSSQPTTRVAP